MGRPLDDEWRNWLSLNLGRGCDLAKLFATATGNGFEPDDVSAALDGFRPSPALSTLATDPYEKPSDERPLSDEEKELASPNLPLEQWLTFFNASLTRADHRPRAWRVDTTLAQLYEIPHVLSRDECAQLIELKDRNAIPSVVVTGKPGHRTSQTCHLGHVDSPLIALLDGRIADLLGIDLGYSEPIQAQRYEAGEYFKEHTDWFTPGTRSYLDHASKVGQRTWTVMVYLSQTEEGGETRFPHLGRDFVPSVGTALAWNNLNADGTPNRFTLHASLPVTRGRKYVITKWFRSALARTV